MSIKIVSVGVTDSLLCFCFFAMLTHTVCFKYQSEDVVYYWSEKVVTSRELTTYDNKNACP